MISLSSRIRPSSIQDFVGQSHFLYENSIFYNSIKNKALGNCIFFGPSGTGKTTLARIICKEMNEEFIEINASSSGIGVLKEIIQNKNSNSLIPSSSPYVYIDEIHRWNKSQQDILLKALEDNIIKIIGSTTENPYFSINSAILSRVTNIIEFKAHSIDDIMLILKNALSNKISGLGNLDIEWDDDAIKTLSIMSNGDSRIALDLLEYISQNSPIKKIEKKLVVETLSSKRFSIDKQENKYNLLSALQKSIRGSDPDASIHYLARLFKSGFDISTIGRRLLVIASEDIGLAYPNAISIVESCVSSANMIGYPEAEIPLAQAVILLASSPKSNTVYMSLQNAKADLNLKEIDDIPMHLKDSHYQNAKDRGIKGYLYPHDFGGYVEQQYLPDNLAFENVKYYNPTENGHEKSFKQYLAQLKKEK